MPGSNAHITIVIHAMLLRIRLLLHGHIAKCHIYLVVHDQSVASQLAMISAVLQPQKTCKSKYEITMASL